MKEDAYKSQLSLVSLRKAPEATPNVVVLAPLCQEAS